MEKIRKFYKLDTIMRDTFIQIPKIFSIRESKYFDMPIEVKYLYGILQDRHKLSIKNKWIDENGYVFFLYNQIDIAEIMGKNVKTIRKYLVKLEEYELLYRVKQGLNKPDKLYLLQIETTDNLCYKLKNKTTKLDKQDGNNIPSKGMHLPTNKNNNINNNNREIREEQYTNNIIENNPSSSLPSPSKVIIPEEAKELMDKYFINRLIRERSLYGINFDTGLYYTLMLEAITLTQLQDSIDILTLNQYSYFIKTLLNKVKLIQ